MRLNYQMRVVLEVSMNSDTPIGVHEVMQYLDISKSAAYLLVQNCQIWLVENQFEKTSSQQRRAVFAGKQEVKESIRSRLSCIQSEDFDFSARERRLFIVILLIRKKYASTHEITELFHISRNTCIQDLARVNQVLGNFQLEYSAGNRGYTLKGSEYDIYRLCLWTVSAVLTGLYPDNYEMALSLFDFPKDEIGDIYRKMEGAVKQYRLPANREALYIFCASCTLVSKRISQDHEISPDMIPEFHEMGQYNSRIRGILVQTGVAAAVMAGRNPGNGCGEADPGHTSLAECLARMLVCVCLETGADIVSIHIKKDCLEDYALQIIQKYESYIGMLFENLEELKKAVALSLKCVLLRRKYGFQIYNTLIKEIKKHYGHIIGLIGKSLEGIPGLEETAEEECILFGINFLGEMYRSRQVTSQTPHILVVCAGNAGTSVLLQGQIEKLLPGAQVLTASLFHDLSRFSEYMDMIVSTIPIEVNEVPALVVNTFLTEHDKTRIKKLTDHKVIKDGNLIKFLKDFLMMSKDFINSEDSRYLHHRLEEYFKINRVKIFYGTGSRPLLKDLVTENRIRIVDSAEDWKEAIRLAAEPLEDDKSIEPAYTEAMIRSVEELGPYIVLAPGIALPHARPETGVRSMSMALLKVNHRVYFTEDKYANLFFVLASADGNSHLDALRELSAIFSEEAAIGRFMKADTPKALYQLIS
ncbi:PTS sugar transporter subunit IIA [Lachnospiraceae bacterium 54-53]